MPLTSDYRHDLPAMAAAVTERTRVILVCSPNNPTSTIVTHDEFEAFMALVPETVLVLLDEAYIEFVTSSEAVRGIPLLPKYPNLVVLRTFSKAYGLAGLRIGYAVGPEYVMDAARATAIPLSVIEQAQRAALASLDHEDQLLRAGRADRGAARRGLAGAGRRRAGTPRGRTATSSGCRPATEPRMRTTFSRPTASSRGRWARASECQRRGGRICRQTPTRGRRGYPKPPKCPRHAALD